MKNIYHFISKFENGGVESQLISSIIRYSPTNIKHIVICEQRNFSIYDDFLKTNNIQFVYLEKSNKISKVFKLIKLNKSLSIEYLHVHISFYSTMFYALVSKFFGVKKVIIHAHTTNSPTTLFPKLFKNIFRMLILPFKIKLIADSKESGQVFFAKKFAIFPIAINYDKFIYSEKLRIIERNRLGITDEILLCNIGRLAEHKNHKYILDLISLLKGKNKKYIAVFVGDGEKKQEIIDYANEKNVRNSLFLEASRFDIESILSASDIFLFPSTYEGLGLVALEAQVNGLFVISSDKVPIETRITDRIKYLSLLDKSSWINEIELISNKLHIERFNQPKFNKGLFTNQQMQAFLENLYE